MTTIKQQSDRAALRARAVIVWLAVLSVLSALCIGMALAAEVL